MEIRNFMLIKPVVCLFLSPFSPLSREVFFGTSVSVNMRTMLTKYMIEVS